MERLKRMSVFAKVVELGSFTAAARQLQMSVSSISQTVAKLEDELQVKLLNRSTRSLGLTEAGKYIIRAAGECCSKSRMSMSSCTRLTIRPSVRCASAALQLWHRMSWLA
jgi:DNA-binding transcriptional LysR family regulator